MDGFLFRNIKIVHKGDILCDVNFINEEYVGSDVPTTSIIIGTNGTGKSFILMVIAEVFDALDNLKNLSNLKYEYYSIEYKNINNYYKIEIKNKKTIAHKNNSIIPISEIELPRKILGVSYMLNDKFKFKINSDSIYQYLGIRLTSNSSYTSTITNKVFENFLEIIIRKNSTDILQNISEFLDIDSKISYIITPDNKKFFTYKKTKAMIKKKIKKYQDTHRYDQLLKLEESDIDNIIGFLEDIKKNHKYIIENEKEIYKFTIDRNDAILNIKELENEYKIIKQLRNLDYIKSVDLILYKNETEYPLESASSGEKHFIYEVVSIANNIENNSLILIDEPEISMHPNWQMKYITTLKNIFNKFDSSHFIVATHSHFIVSDLDEKSSSLISIDYNPITKERNSSLLKNSTYAWSAENILYNIFGVRTTRNYYFEIDMRELIEIVSSQDYDRKEEAIEYISKLKKYIFNDMDPLCKIISAAEEFVKND